jgi:hypothetical protein
VTECEVVYGNKEEITEQREGILGVLYKKAKQVLVKHSKEEIPTVVYPQEEEKQLEVSTHPTICLATASGEPRGILVYEGMEGYPDFELDRTLCVIGKSSRARMQISRSTISNFHAKIDYMDGYYIEDMNSTNGTFVNNEILNYREKRELKVGDIVGFADVKYRFL